MNTLALFGKQYNDNILIASTFNVGETNQCQDVVKRSGGCYNFLDANIKDIKLTMMTKGSKSAYIISDKLSSKRTSFVIDEKKSIVSIKDVQNINRNFDWIHICYIDDIESYCNLHKVRIPMSVDFCTLRKRFQYSDIMKISKVIFDSRERKYLYENLSIDTPIIFHDESGFEIVENKKIIHKESVKPISGLNVNGAGDIYAAYFIKHYDRLGMIKSASAAMKNTTDRLIERDRHE